MKFSAKQKTFTFLIFFGIYGLTYAESYWIAPRLEAKTETGSYNAPYASIEKALQRHGGGNIYIFKPGIYTGQINLKSEYKGAPQNPTVLKSEQKDKAILHGSAGHNLYILEGADWVIIDGFEVRCAAIDGLKTNANYTVFRNCWVHHNCEVGIAAFGVQNVVIERNLVEFNGSHIQFTHGIYANSQNITIRENIVRFNASHGIHLYPNVSESLVENNLVYGNTRSGVLIYCLPGGSNNKIINNTIVDNGYGIYIKDGKGEVIVNNIISGNTRWRYGVSNSAIDLTNTDIKNIKIENNLIYPKAALSDANNIYVDPQFINPEKGVFFLRLDSPAIKKGSLKYMTKCDFWGRKRPDNIQPDIGCFSYDGILLKEEYRKNWYYGWPFFFNEGTGPLPDLWADTNR